MFLGLTLKDSSRLVIIPIVYDNIICNFCNLGMRQRRHNEVRRGTQTIREVVNKQAAELVDLQIICWKVQGSLSGSA